MDMIEYELLAMKTSVSHADANKRLLNACLGLSGEVGEFCDLVKKNIFHGHNTNAYKLYEELGDILWYITQACDALGISMNTVAKMNIDKLQRRYPEGFSSERSVNREDRIAELKAEIADLISSDSEDKNEQVK